jgi:hypothetical protein
MHDTDGRYGGHNIAALSCTLVLLYLLLSSLINLLMYQRVFGKKWQELGGGLHKTGVIWQEQTIDVVQLHYGILGME